MGVAIETGDAARRTESGVMPRAKRLPREVTGSHVSQDGNGPTVAKGSVGAEPLPSERATVSRLLRLAIAATSSQRAVARRLGIRSTGTVARWCDEGCDQCIPSWRREQLRRKCPRVYAEMLRLEGLSVAGDESALVVSIRRDLDALEREHARLIAVMRARLEAEERGR